MKEEAQDLREELYGVINYYAELAELASKGEADPISQIGRIIKKRYPYLLLVIRDFLPDLERGEKSYYDALYDIVRAAQQFPNIKTLHDSLDEIEKIEQRQKAFAYAVKWLGSKTYIRPTIKEAEEIRNILVVLNTKYKQLYAPEAGPSGTVIPCYLPKKESDSDEFDFMRTTELVRRAVIELFHLMIENEPLQSFLIFKDIRKTDARKGLERDLADLAWFLFRSGYSVDLIASGYYKRAEWVPE